MIDHFYIYFCNLNRNTLILIEDLFKHKVVEILNQVYKIDFESSKIVCSVTRKEHEGDYTITVFNLAQIIKKSPEIFANELGERLKNNWNLISKFNVVKGFLNLSLKSEFWLAFVAKNYSNTVIGFSKEKNNRVLIEYSSPNTNKPLHLGHIRNILLGWSSAKIVEAAGNEVFKVKVVNDRGIAICKSMLAWQLYGNGKTPETENIKGDHFVGDYYVMFEQEFKKEYAVWQKLKIAVTLFEERKNKTLDEAGFFAEYKNEYFNNYSKLGGEARKMLLRWEANDIETRALWKTMNSWVYKGFNETYKKLGTSFDKIYYESDQYELGREIIEHAIKSGVFYKKEDTSVWIDLTDAKLDQKLVLRSDGTTVYITQDIGMAMLRENDFHAQKVVYVVADEQDYHFKVLFEILKKLNQPFANGLFHLSYGLVELPSGRMKSREGTVVDADDLIAEVIKEAERESEERGTLDGYSVEERQEIVRRIAMAAMKYSIIKVNPKKKIIFDPKESVDFEGHTGPYIQYAFVRANGVVSEAQKNNLNFDLINAQYELLQPELELVKQLYVFESRVGEAAENYDPSVIAQYTYDVAKTFNRFWHDCSIFKEPNPETKNLRLQMCQLTAQTLKNGFELLGIEMPSRM